MKDLNELKGKLNVDHLGEGHADLDLAVLCQGVSMRVGAAPRQTGGDSHDDQHDDQGELDVREGESAGVRLLAGLGDDSFPQELVVTHHARRLLGAVPSPTAPAC